MASYSRQALPAPAAPAGLSLGRAGAAGIAMLCGFGGAFLAWHHPLAPAWGAGVFSLVVLFGLRYRDAWLVTVPSLLPVLAFAPWSGWMSFEEMDLLVLALAAAGHARIAVSAARSGDPSKQGAGPLAGLCVGLFMLSTLISTERGFSDAGGWAWGWYQGYHEPMNSLRIAKGAVLALLLWPLWNEASRRAPARAGTLLARGLLLGLGAAALAALWERLGFTGLLDFSTDYRTTALFWEMHVGGAALDGFLALTWPFALYVLLQTRRPAPWLGAAVIACLGGYACLTTFSRGVYLAVPTGIAVLVALQAVSNRRGGGGSSQSVPRGLPWAAGLLCAIFIVSGAWMFGSSGYRGLLALFGTFALMLALPVGQRALPAGQRVIGGVSGAAAAAAGYGLEGLLPKAAYLSYAAAVSLALAAFLLLRRRRSTGAAFLLWGAWAWAVVAMLHIAWHWGGEPGLTRAAPVALLLIVVAVCLPTRRSPWPASLRWRAGVLGVMLTGAGVVAVFSGGAYMGGRFSTGSDDLALRITHWRDGLGLLSTPADWLLGRGLGRYPADNYLATMGAEHPGDYRLRTEGERQRLVLAAGQQMLGWGEVLRVSQRIAPPGAAPLARVEVRTVKPVNLHLEVCEKNLLYNAQCQLAEIGVGGKPGVWQPIEVRLDGPSLSRGPWYAPRPIVFSIALATPTSVADIAQLSLTGDDGSEMLQNGGFDEGLARWFFTSDRNHLPWHIKNLLLDLLLDQGLVGLLLWSAMFTGALWRLAWGHARDHPLAPPLAAALVGFLVVGMFDSLLDVPRIAWLHFLLLFIALGLRGPLLPVALQPLPAGRLRGAATAACIAAAVLVASVWPGEARAADGVAVLRVGPGRAVHSIAEAARLARPGDTIEVDAGRYTGDVAVWTQDRLDVRASGGRVRLVADGAAAEGKAIWVVRANAMTVQGFDFEGAAVPSRNGAGIRLDRGSLKVRDCSFVRNEMGLLTGNDPATELDVEGSEFAHNQRPDGHDHNLYAGTIRRLAVRGSYFHHAARGHLLKSRAALNLIEYNRLGDETGGSASYELEFPNGGIAYVVGNLIQQSATTANPVMVSFGAEGYSWPANELYFAFNTLIDDLPAGGVFARVWPGAGTVRIVDNLLVGAGRWEAGPRADLRNNLALPRAALGGSDETAYHPAPADVAALRPLDAGVARGRSLTPVQQYLHPRRTIPLDAAPSVVGAWQPNRSVP